MQDTRAACASYPKNRYEPPMLPMSGWWQREASSVTVEHPTLIDHIITVPAAIDAAAGFVGNLGAGGASTLPAAIQAGCCRGRSKGATIFSGQLPRIIGMLVMEDFTVCRRTPTHRCLCGARGKLGDQRVCANSLGKPRRLTVPLLHGWDDKSLSVALAS